MGVILMIEIIHEVEANEDNYSWEEVDCFVKAWAITVASFNKDFYDDFIWYLNFSNTFKLEFHIDALETEEKQADRYFNSLTDKLNCIFGIKIDQKFFNKEDEFHSIIESAISERCIG